MKGHHGHGGGKGCHGGHHGHGWRLRVHPHGHIDQAPRHHHTSGGHHMQRSGCGGCHGYDGSIIVHHGGHDARKKGPHDHRGGGLDCHGRKHHKHGGHGKMSLGCHGRKHHKHGGHGKQHRCHHVDMVVNRNTTPEIDAITEAVLQIGWTDAASPEIGAIAGEIPSDAS